jgi:hypothetical protein
MTPWNTKTLVALMKRNPDAMSIIVYSSRQFIVFFRYSPKSQYTFRTDFSTDPPPILRLPLLRIVPPDTYRIFSPSRLNRRRS